MEMTLSELQEKNELLMKENAELKACQQDYRSAKQSLNRMSTRLRKLCKRLTPTSEIVIEMQKIAEEIRGYARQATALTEKDVENDD